MGLANAQNGKRDLCMETEWSLYDAHNRLVMQAGPGITTAILQQVNPGCQIANCLELSISSVQISRELSSRASAGLSSLGSFLYIPTLISIIVGIITFGFTALTSNAFSSMLCYFLTFILKILLIHLK